MKRVISIMLALLIVFGALPNSFAIDSENTVYASENAVYASDEKPITKFRAPSDDEGEAIRLVNGMQCTIDSDPAGGYEGEYVVIYNASESATFNRKTGNMTGLIDTSISSSVVTERSEAELVDERGYIIDVDPYFMEQTLELYGENIVFPEGTKSESFNVGDTKEFVLAAYSPLETDSVEFVLLHKSEHCYVWTPNVNNSNVYAIDASLAELAASEFESKFSLMNESFGSHEPGSGDGRVNLLYYNIDDGWAPGGGGYVAGYFTGADYLNSNALPMLHLDTYPSVYDTNGVASVDNFKNSYSTIVHEYQHMIHFSINPSAEVWINESMSAAAEEICYPGSSIFNRIMSYTQCPWTYDAIYYPAKEYATSAANLHNGYSMYAWDQSIPDIIPLYAQVSLFSQYLYSRFGNGIFKQLLSQMGTGMAFQAACRSVLNTTAADFVRDFRLALVINGTADVLDGRYGFKLQPGYDPSNYYGITNPYNILGPIIFQGSSCSIKGGGAITVKPVGGVYNPPSDANSALKYYGISFSNEGGDTEPTPTPAPTPVPSIDPNGKLYVDRTFYLEADGTYTAKMSAYSTSLNYDASTRIIDYISSDLYYGSNLSISAATYNCTGLDANGDPVFSSSSNGYFDSLNVAYSPVTRYLYFDGFDFAENVCTAEGGKKLVFWVYGILPDNDAVGTFSACIDAKSGVYVNGKRVIPLPHCDLYIRERSFAYDFGTQIDSSNTFEFFGSNDVSFIRHIDTAFNEVEFSNASYVYHSILPYNGTNLGYSAVIRNTAGNIHVSFTPDSISGNDNIRALLRLTDGRYEWCRLNFFPSSVVLYEEGFVGFTRASYAVVDGEPVNILWHTEGAPNTISQSSGGSVYGYDASYADNTGDSNDSSRKVTVNRDLLQAVAAGESTWPSFEFSFTGTGFDIITRSGIDTGVLTMDLVPEDAEWNYVGANAKHLTIDTYYAGDTMYQIPMFHVEGLEYGAYKVHVVARYSPRFDHQSEDYAPFKGEYEIDEPGLEPGVRYTVINAWENEVEAAPARSYGSFTTYIDGIRIYNPINTSSEGNETVEAAYSAACELNPIFKNLRNMLRTTAANQANTVLNFGIDSEIGSAAPADYNEISPLNEVYIKHNMGVAFAISNYTAGTRVHISAKSHTIGEGFKLKINGSILKDASGSDVVVNHTTELYYDITDYVSAEGLVFILCQSVNSSEAPVLSLINLKLIPSAQNGTTPSVTAANELLDFIDAISFGITGDANHDGLVTALDALLVMRAALGNLELGIYGGICADVNGDGRIDMVDALAVMRIALTE